MSVPVAHGLVYDDLASFPDDHLRRELIDGELYVTPSPVRRHQRAVLAIAYALETCARQHGGEVLPAPMDVLFDPANVGAPTSHARGSHLDCLAAPSLALTVGEALGDAS